MSGLSNQNIIVALGKIGLLGVLLSLAACGQFPKSPSVETTEADSTSVAPVVQQPQPLAAPEVIESQKASLASAKMPPDVMYKIMVGEMLVQKGQSANAFGVLYPVAAETKDPGLAERVFKLSMTTYDLNAIQASAKLWRDVSPQEAMAWKASYLISVREGKVSEALTFWKRYQALSKVTLEQDLIATGIRVAQAAPEKDGLRFLAELKAQYPEIPAASFALGAAAESYRAYETAIPALEAAAQMYQARMKAKPDDYDAQKLYRESNQLLANAFLKSGQADLGLQRLTSYINQNPDDWLMQERFARLEVKAGYFDAAEKRYQRIVENEPKAYTSRLSLALLRLERGAFAKADASLKSLQKVPQYRSTANYYLGVSAQKQGEPEQAITYFKMIDSADYLVDARLHIAEMEYPKIGLDRTIENLEAIPTSELNDQIKVLRGKAIFYNIAGNKEKAIGEYQQAIELDDQKADLYLMQAMLFYDLQQYDAYEQNLEKALALDSENVDALNALGYFLVEQGRDLERAEQLLDKALSIAPNRYYVLDSRGWLAYQLGDYEQAKQYLERALAIQMDDEVLLHLIQAKWRLGEKAQAVELWQAHHRKFPDNEPLQQIIETLESP
ncbi:MAG: tetratricopeptide repeat protein [Hydrogenovibrio sp.]